jgi:hypothetical protein
VLLLEMFSLEVSIQELQKNYLDDHAMLSPEFEHRLETMISLVSELIVTFNEYVNAKADRFRQDSGRRTPSLDEVRPSSEEESYSWRCLRIDVKFIRTWAGELAHEAFVSAWETEARHKAIVDILRETGAHETVLWDHFCQTASVDPLAQIKRHIFR